MRKNLRHFAFGLFLLLYPHLEAKAISLTCVASTAVEYYLPGVGYLTQGEWDKAFVLGGSRWALRQEIINRVQSPNFNMAVPIYQDLGTSMVVTYNKETWEAYYYNTLEFNLMLTTLGDMYQNDCGKRERLDTYQAMTAPLRVDHWFNRMAFWGPLIVLGYSVNQSGSWNVNYQLGTGLTPQQLREQSLWKYYSVGVGEEMFFRGAVQQGFYDLYKEGFSWNPAASWHLSVLSGAYVFGQAHSGNGFSADSLTAFWYGVYLGYVYNPAPGEYDMMTAIAVHAWWDIIVAYGIINSASYQQNPNAYQVPIFTYAGTF